MARYTSNERRVLALTGTAHFAAHFFELMFPTLAVALAAESGLPLAQVLGWSFLGYLFFGLGALPAGLLADRVGGRRMLVAGLLGMGVASLAAGLVAPGASLAGLLAVIGLAGSVYHPAGMSLISHTVRARGRALGVNGICGNAGIALTPVVTAALTARLGWQRTYVVVGLATCAVALAAALLLRVDERPVAAAPPLPALRGRQRVPLLFALLCLAAALAGVSYRANTLAQPAYFAARVDLLGYGAITSLVSLAGIGGQYLGGHLADRHDLRWLYLGFHALTVPALLLVAATRDTALIASAAWVAFLGLGMQPIENSLFGRLTPARWRATGYGIKFVMTFGVGSLAVGVVQRAEAGGDPSVLFRWLAGVIAALVVTVLVLILASAGQRVRNVSPVEELAA